MYYALADKIIRSHILKTAEIVESPVIFGGA